MLSFFFLNAKCVDYSLSGTVLTITGEGTITKEGVRSKGVFSTFTDIIIKNGPSSITENAFLECRAMKYLKISETITSIQPCFSRCWNLATIEVDSLNNNYMTDSQGLLCSKDHKLLLRVPIKKGIILEEGIETIESNAFGTERKFNFGDIVFPLSLKFYKTAALSSAKFGSISFKSPSQITSIPEISWSELDTMTIPNSVLQISANTFSSTTINKIIFESGSKLEIVGAYAFSSIKITEMTLPDSVKEIQDNAFSSSTIEKITIGRNVELISNSAFSLCTQLKQIIVAPENKFYSSIDGIVMDYNETQIIFMPAGKTELTIAASVKEISKTLLQSLKNINTITLESNEIWSTAGGVLYSKDFTSLIAICGGVESVTVDSRTTKIEEYAAYYCDKLTSFSFGESNIERIETSAFHFSGISSVTIPSSVTYIGPDAFHTKSLTNVEFSPDSPLTTINTQTFLGAKMSSIVFPNSISVIGTHAFGNCINLKTITFNVGSAIREIHPKAFYGSGLESLELPSTITIIREESFCSCNNLQTVVFKEDSQLGSIGNAAFYDCKLLWKVELPKLCTQIGTQSFFGDVELVEFKHSLTTIGNSAFKGCISLRSFNFSETQTTVDSSAFQECINLQNFYVDDRNEVLMDSKGCVFDINETKLVLFPPGQENAYIPSTIVEFADNAFAWSPKLKMVAFYSGSRLETIGHSSFYGCKNLKIIQFPPRLRIIGEKSFYGCSSLQLVNFPDSLESIEDNAFALCNSLSTIKYCGTNRVQGSKAFDQKAKIFVTDLYPNEDFCSIGVVRKLSFNCELKAEYEKTLSCRKYFLPSPLMFAAFFFLSN